MQSVDVQEEPHLSYDQLAMQGFQARPGDPYGSSSGTCIAHSSAALLFP